tara:strand:+ start:251 stop:493 length:243 start_codon:yes stop_codon:yes gene_type:complete
MISQFMPLILKMVLPKATDHIAKVFKLDKVLKYVEQPNEADIKCNKLEVEVKDLKRITMDLTLKLDALKTFIKDMQDERS